MTELAYLIGAQSKDVVLSRMTCAAATVERPIIIQQMTHRGFASKE